MTHSELRKYLVRALEHVDSGSDLPCERARLYQDLRRQLAGTIVEMRLGRIDHTSHIEYRVDCYVIPVDEMLKVVRQEALDLLRRMNSEERDVDD